MELEVEYKDVYLAKDGQNRAPCKGTPCRPLQFPANDIESVQRFKEAGDLLESDIQEAVRMGHIPVLLALGQASQSFVRSLSQRISGARVANLRFMRSTGIQIYPDRNDNASHRILYNVKEELMSPLANVFNDIVETLGGNSLNYRKKEGKRVALGTKLVGFGQNPYCVATDVR